MVFITTGQRIATENFADGVIYKVTFVDTTISYMMCVGIGQDFVMLQGPDPSLFCLTMSSASRVSTIDIHDPTPPEPPTPIENALQYQTGEPPFTFTTTESSLFSWYIEGPCGVKTANLFNIDDVTLRQISDTQRYAVAYTDVGTYSATAYGESGGYCYMRIKHSDDTWGDIQTIVVGSSINTRTVTISEGDTLYIYCASNISESAALARFESWQLMVNKGETVLPFEPYGKYKISILSNEHAETIYLDEALAEGERLYSVNTETVIATDIGENTLSVTPTPPEMQIVYGIYAEA